MAESVGQQSLRAENVSKTVKGFALRQYKFKQVCTVVSSSAWQETYYQETAADLTGGTTSGVRGVPRLAAFPYGEVTSVKKSSYMEKYGMQAVISWEDSATNNIPVIARALLRIARAVAKAVDDQIWAVISESQSAVDINSVAIGAGNEWDSATVANRDPIGDVLNAKKEIAEEDYDPEVDGFLLLSPKDYANLLKNSKVSNNPSYRAADVVANGRVGRILNLDIIVSNSVTADYALVILGGMAATWLEASPLTTVTIEDPGISFTIRSWEVGVTQLTNPKAVTLISNTAA